MRSMLITAVALGSVSCTGQPGGGSLVRTLPDRTFRFSDGSQFKGSLTLTARDGNLYSHVRFVAIGDSTHFQRYFQTLKQSISDTNETLSIKLIGARGAHLKQRVQIGAADIQNSASLVAASSVTPITNNDYSRASNWQVSWLKLLDPYATRGKYVENPRMK